MNRAKRISNVFLVILIVSVVVACGTVPLKQASNEIATNVPTFITVAETPTPVSTFKPGALPTIDILPTPSAQLTKTPEIEPLPISRSPEQFPLDNLRMFYIMNGNLYVQDGNNSPKRLSNSEEDLYPVFFVSDDGKKIVFYHGKIKDDADIFSINADGSHEQELIRKDWLTKFGEGTKMGEVAFVPNTHQMLFNTYLCPKDFSLACTVGLYLVDTDTREIKEFVPLSLGRNLYEYGNFSISPDGRLISIAREGQIDILSVDGKVINQNIMKYTRSRPFELYPRVFWLSDSSGLIVALPDKIEYGGLWSSGYPVYSIWKYTFDSSLATQISLDPAPTWVSMDCNDVMSVSPNGDWVVYHTNDYQVYKVNLVDGTVNLYLPYMYCLPTHWSSDNIHFINGGNPEQSVMGTVNKRPASIPGFFLGWIDERRYIYFQNSAFLTKENIQILVGEIGEKTLLTSQSNISIPDIYPYSFTFTILNGK
jgi:hypothetical protein